jgi:hypothetical protein
MHISSPIRIIIEDIQLLSGGKLTLQPDLGTLLELAQRSGRQLQMQELSFQAKFVASMARMMSRIGPETEGYAKLSTEFQSAIERVQTAIRALLQDGDEEDRQHFERTYFALTPGSLQGLVALCYDLGWYKNYLLEQAPSRTASQTRPSGLAWRFALLVLILGAVVWIGALHARAVIGNELLDVGTLTVNTTLPPAAERMLYRLFAGTGILMITGYVAVLIAGGVFLARSPYRPRQHGWLMMSAILLYLFVPVEGYAMILDVRMILVEFAGGADPAVLRELFQARIGALAGAPFVALLCYYTIVVLAVFQPLRLIRKSGA